MRQACAEAAVDFDRVSLYLRQFDINWDRPVEP
jgi:hypothetical protein